MAHDFRKLLIWKKSLDLTVLVYETTKKFPKEEIFWLTSQIRRAISSIPANIAEWSARGTDKDFAYFIWIAHWSANEVMTFIVLSEKLGYIDKEVSSTIINELEEIGNMLSVFCKKLRS